MKKNVIIFGSIAGAVLLIVMLFSAAACYNNPDYYGNMWLGYGSMLVAFSLIFVAVKNVRDNYLDGFISFGKAFQTGLFITLIASTAYVLTWLFEYYVFYPDFMDKYVAHIINEAHKSGATAAQIQDKKESMAGYVEMYKSTFGVIVLTYLEVLPVGLVIALIAALILKRKDKGISASPTIN